MNQMNVHSPHIKDLFNKYDVPVPRYTSYPTMPSWSGNLTTEDWTAQLRSSFEKEGASWSLYLHLPFCESLCTFCACNNIITRDHTKEDRYIQALHTEWDLYLKAVPQIKEKNIKQVHLGGGSPTFFTAENLKRLLDPIFSKLRINKDIFEGAIEVDPRRCTFDQLKTLREFGFSRISLGVQDVDEDVQKNVNRMQPIEMVQNCVGMARKLGFGSINFDLIYGLPGQTEESIRNTAKSVLELKPDRMALYSLAVVPWMKPAQNRFERMEMKKGYDKRRLYDVAREVFLEAGYMNLGIDHFARPEDALSKAFINKTMHRNFMGYTEYATDILLGLGVSSISETEGAFHQNEKALDDYYNRLEIKDELPTMKGHLLTPKDREIRKKILQLMTSYSSELNDEEKNISKYQEMEREGILTFQGNRLILTELGVSFARHVCHELDMYSNREASVGRFSSGV